MSFLMNIISESLIVCFTVDSSCFYSSCFYIHTTLILHYRKKVKKPEALEELKFLHYFIQNVIYTCRRII